MPRPYRFRRQGRRVRPIRTCPHIFGRILGTPDPGFAFLNDVDRRIATRRVRWITSLRNLGYPGGPVMEARFSRGWNRRRFRCYQYTKRN